MNNNVAKVVLLSLALAVFAAALYVYRPIQNKFTRVAVTGEAQAKVSPDTAVVTFSVVTQNAQALNAQQENARKSEAVKAAVESISADDNIEVKTSDYNLSPEQDYYSSGKLPKILGYTVKNTVTVSIKNLSKVGTVIDAATKAGANSV
ncbi:MAG: SIMPL domain-containing protein, partial [Acidobacteriota bacterium]|nr:SIMPL domain-containing protein [Acidobacteriota bacterium]